MSNSNKKKICYLAASTILLGSLVSSTLFSTSIANAAESNVITPNAVPDAGEHTVVYSNKELSKTTDFTHTATNNSDTNDTVSFAVSHQFQAKVSVGAESEFNTLVAGAKVSANVEFGYSNTKIVTENWVVGKGTWKLTAGTNMVKASGIRYTIGPQGQLLYPQPLAATYSSGTWSDKSPN